MTETQFYILTTVLGVGLASIGTAIRFGIGRAVRAIDKNSDSMIENTKSNAILSTKIDAIAHFVEKRGVTINPPTRHRSGQMVLVEDDFKEK